MRAALPLSFLNRSTSFEVLERYLGVTSVAYLAVPYFIFCAGWLKGSWAVICVGLLAARGRGERPAGPTRRRLERGASFFARVTGFDRFSLYQRDDGPAAETDQCGTCSNAQSKLTGSLPPTGGKRVALRRLPWRAERVRG